MTNQPSVTKEGIEALKKGEMGSQVTTKLVTWIVQQVRKDLILAKESRFTGLSKESCLEYVKKYHKSIFKTVIEGLIPKQPQKGRPKANNRTQKDAVPKTVVYKGGVVFEKGKEVVMLMDSKKCGKGVMMSQLSPTHVRVKCVSVAVGYEIRIPSGNTSELEIDDIYKFSLVDLADEIPSHEESSVVTELANNTLEEISVSKKRSRDEIEDVELPANKRPHYIQVEQDQYQLLLQCKVELETLREEFVRKENEWKLKQLQLDRELAFYYNIESKILDVGRMCKKKYASGDQDPVKNPEEFMFNGIIHSMSYDLYHKLKGRNQCKFVMKELLLTLGVELQNRCLPKDKRSGRVPFTELEVDSIVAIAKKHFVCFHGMVVEKVRSKIGQVCSDAAGRIDVEDNQSFSDDSTQNDSNE